MSKPDQEKQTARPKNTQATRQLLLEHGLAIATKKGLRGLTVREVASNANVNLGSFVYHFGSRDRFVSELVELWYEPLFDRLKITAATNPDAPAFTRLQITLVQLLELIAANASFVSHLLADALTGETAAQAFILSVPARHPSIMIDLIAKAQAEGSIVKQSPVMVMLFIMTATGLPLVLGGSTLQHADWLPKETYDLSQLLNDPDAVKQRLRWALKGISTADSLIL